MPNSQFAWKSESLPRKCSRPDWNPSTRRIIVARGQETSTTNSQINAELKLNRYFNYLLLSILLIPTTSLETIFKKRRFAVWLIACQLVFVNFWRACKPRWDAAILGPQTCREFTLGVCVILAFGTCLFVHNHCEIKFYVHFWRRNFKQLNL